MAAAIAVLAIALSGIGTRSAHAGCDVIPPALQTFRGELGRVSRPFARPDDWVTLTLDPNCHAPAGGFADTVGDLVVTVVFRPPGNGPRNVLVLATSCAGIDVAGCAARPDVSTAACMLANPPLGPTSFERIDGTSLRFRFPDSDNRFLAANDDLTLTGPVSIAVTPRGSPLPCALASSSCADTPGLLACVDALYTENGSCNRQPHATFPEFTALPPPNNYQALCTQPSPPCTGTSQELRFTVDAGGNILLPMDWRGVRVDRDAVPVARLLRASSTVEAFEGRGAPIRIPDLASLSSYSAEGVKLPPLFDPQSDPSATSVASFFGSTDAAETVLRIARHRAPSNQCDGGAGDGLPCRGHSDCGGGTCKAPVCTGGDQSGAACSTDFDCPGAECGPGLFDFSGRLLGQRGPVLLRIGACIGGANALEPCSADGECAGGQCGAFTMEALDPVPLDGLSQSSALNAFVTHESIHEPPVDLNGDGDTTDPVIKLADRASGAIEPIGPGGSEARAIARVQQGGFTFPAVAVDGDVVAYLEPEPWQGAVDTNDNRRVFETILRVHRLGAGEVTDPDAPLAADAAPLVNDRSLTVSNGLVFFRAPEAANAAQETTRVNVNSAGAQATGGFQSTPGVSLSADGRYAAFLSDATNLVTPDVNNGYDAFVRDRLTGTTVRVSINGAGVQGNNPSWTGPHMTPDGRHVTFGSYATNLAPGITNAHVDIFVHDRDADGNGVFDETGPGQRRTARVSVASDGTEANDFSRNDTGGISADGRFVTYFSYASNLVAGDTNGVRDIFVHDRDADDNGIFDETGPGQRKTVRVSVASDGGQANGESRSSSISADGRFVVFESAACNLIPGDCVTTGDTNGVPDVFLHDRDADGNGIFDEPGGIETTRVAVDSNGTQANNWSAEPRISADGSTVVFSALASNLVAGDTNGLRDIFAHDVASGRTTAITIAPNGRLGNSNSGTPFATADGRFVVFNSRARNLTAGVVLHEPLVFLHDRLTRLTTLASVNMDGGPPNDWTVPALAISADGSTVAFAAWATDLVPGDTNGLEDVFVRAPVPGSGDLSGDGVADDTILRVLDATTGPPSPLIDLCPAGRVAVAAGRAAFLRPETAGDTPGLAACPSGTLVDGLPDLNGDGDTDDDVVHLWDGAGVVNLARAATDLALSEVVLAALVSEADDGGTDLNADGDADDTVVHAHAVGAGTWTNIGQAADAIVLEGPWLAFLTPEAAQHGADLNGDGDSDDRVLRVYDAVSATLADVGQAAEEMVIGSAGLVAFRTLESSQGGEDLNGDGDDLDGVLQVYDAVSGILQNSGQAVTPCRLEACDPRVPYRVRNDTVTFLTFETDQNADLNNDGDLGDLVLQVLNVRRLGGAATLTLGGASAGICTDTASACADASDCPAGDCFVPPGGCVRNVGTPCDPATNAGCFGVPYYCQPILGAPSMGTCHVVESACSTDVQCALGATCNRESRDLQRVMDPLTDLEGGTAVFTGAGRCIEDRGTGCTTSVQCQTGEYCDEARCKRDHGVCASHDDCPPHAYCQATLVRATADDADLDELPDAIDNCPDVPNVGQEDFDGDGVGDACDTFSCGDGVVQEAEACDDGNAVDGDGCDTNCTITACGNGIVTAGEECDDGNDDPSDGCLDSCTICGNGVTTSPEECDDGNFVDGDGCDSNCTLPGCGNQVVNPGEECDDGNAVDTDACKSDCTFNLCGDGVVHAGVEGCDDGNFLDGDGCDSTCTPTACGNGIRTPGEECDDGNLVDGDGCDSQCRLPARLASGSRLAFSHHPATGRRVLRFATHDRIALQPPFSALQNPTLAGARMDLFNHVTGERASVALPASNWVGLGNPAGTRGYRYVDREGTHGPCKAVVFKHNRSLTAVCRGADISFTLDEPQQGMLHVSLRLGDGIGARKFCLGFGGEITADRGIDGQTKGLFRARGAPPPGTCPG